LVSLVVNLINGFAAVFVFACGGAGSYSLSLFKRPVLLPCNHLFCEFVTSFSLLCCICRSFCLLHGFIH